MISRLVRVYMFRFLLFLLPIIPCFSQDSWYEVQRGDTLYGIARTYEIPVDHLRQLNDLEDTDQIFVGQRLRVPHGFIEYQVQRGDTLFALARKYDSSVDSIRSINGFSESDVLRVGQIIQLPAVSEVQTAASDSGTTEAVSFTAQSDAYASNEGDTGGQIMWPHAGERSRAEGKFPGVFISGHTGDPVVSVSTGRVVYSGPHSAFGHVVFVQSPGGYIYVYGGSSEPEVRVGQQVVPGYRIGMIADNPLTQETAVFFSVWKDNRFLPPENAPRS